MSRHDFDRANAWNERHLLYGRHAVSAKVLAKDLHPHVRRRELMRRAYGSLAAGTCAIGLPTAPEFRGKFRGKP